MFHEGSLQSGIALAIQQQKLVACLVRGKAASQRARGRTDKLARRQRNEQRVGRVAEERMGTCIRREMVL
jgi:hypothetical protein